MLLKNYSPIQELTAKNPVVSRQTSTEVNTFELGHSDRFYHARAVRDLSTFVTKSYETCPFYIKVTNSNILLHTSLAVLFSESVKSKVL